MTPTRRSRSAQTYTHYLPCGDHVGRRDEQREQTDWFHSQGLATTTYFNPMICTGYAGAYDEAVDRGALTEDQAGDPYVYHYSTDTGFLVSQFDFSRPAGRGMFGELLGEAVADGYDGWMEDFGEYTPLDSRSANGMNGTEMHNLYPVQYHCAAQDFARNAERPLGRFIRSGFTGVAPCAQIVWGGDPTVGWGFDGLASAVTNGLTMGLSGISTWGSDIGGFFALGANAAHAGAAPALGPVRRRLRRHADAGERDRAAGEGRGRRSGTPTRSATGAATPSSAPSSIRTSPPPTATYRRSGLPIMRQLALAYPDDRRAVGQDDEFLFGPDLLAAPVIEPGARERRLYLPRGRWIDLWRSAAYGEDTGGLRLGSAKLLRGRRAATIPAPLDELPLLVRAGAVLPLLPPDVDTLAAYGGGDEASSGCAIAPTGSSCSPSRAGAACPASTTTGGSHRSSDRGRWTLRIRGNRGRSYGLQASLGTLKRPLRPCRVLVDGRRLPGSEWDYRAGEELLTAQFSGARAKLTVIGRGRRPLRLSRARARPGRAVPLLTFRYRPRPRLLSRRTATPGRPILP